MNRKMLLWLRCHIWLTWACAGAMALFSALLFGIVMAGYQMPHYLQLTAAALIAACSVLVIWLNVAMCAYRDLMTQILLEDLEPRSL